MKIHISTFSLTNIERDKDMYIIPKIGYITVFHPFEEGADEASKINEEGAELLENFTINIIKSESLVSSREDALAAGELFRKSDVDAVVVRLATWSSDNLLLDLHSICDVPVVNWGLESMNSGSMCGAQQYNAVLKELGEECRFIYRDTQFSLINMYTFILVAAIRKKLQRLRIAIIGNRTQGMAEVICDEFSLRTIFGPRIISLGFGKFKQMVRSTSSEECSGIVDDWREKIPNIEVGEEDLINSARNYLAMRNLVDKHDLAGIAVECYPEYMGQTCLGFSRLADEGIVGACEGDLNSLVLMWIMQNFSRSPVHHIDPLFLYDEDHSMVGSHCGSGSMYLAEDQNEIKIDHVRLADKGACIMYPSKPGVVTMANLIGREKTYRMAIIVGEAERTELVFPGNPVRIQFPFANQTFLDLVEIGGFGHHWVVAYGDISDELFRLCDFLGVDALNFNSQSMGEDIL